ncbi:MAG TPA: beta-1,6-N-acetylglucosaminyltransferase [Flavipsychrobacter sp.]|nr:beta-1,6-N-acetylglucosaminyltransferase [Flavipsychrobacter sp.]
MKSPVPSSDKFVYPTVRIAYFVLVHRFPQQFMRLFKAIYHIDNQYLVHIDKKADNKTYEIIHQFLIQYPNAHIMESANIVWGGYSMVQAELNGMKQLLSLGIKWDFFINLSGQDFPLKSQNDIRRFLSRNKKSNFIKLLNQEVERPDTMNRIEHYFTETDTGFSAVTHKRAFMKNVTSFIGGQWMILNRRCCEFICHSPEVKKFEEYYFNTLIADESFFQTVLMNTSFAGTIVNDDKRFIIWIPDGLIKLRPKTLTISDLSALSEGDHLFARKFDMEHDPIVIDILEEKIRTHAVTEIPTGIPESEIEIFT